MADDVMTRMRLEDPPESTFLQKFGDFANAMRSRNLNHFYTGPQGREDRHYQDKYREWLFDQAEDGAELTPGEKNRRSLLREAATGRYSPPPQRATRKSRTRGDHGVIERMQMRDWDTNEWVDQEGSEVFQPNPTVDGYQYYTKGYGPNAERWRNNAQYDGDMIVDTPGTDHRVPGDSGGDGEPTEAEKYKSALQRRRRAEAVDIFGMSDTGQMSNEGYTLFKRVMKAIDDPADKARKRGFGDMGFEEAQAMIRAIITPLFGGEMSFEDLEDPEVLKLLGFRHQYMNIWRGQRDADAAGNARQNPPSAGGNPLTGVRESDWDSDPKYQLPKSYVPGMP